MADGTESSPNASSASASVTPGSPVSFIVTVNSSSRSMKASLAAALLLSNLGLAQTPSTPIPSTLFGMHTSGSARWPGTPVGALGKGTCEGWANEEPTRGVFNWSITDGFVAAARDHGVTHFAVPGWLPQWAENPAYATGVCQTQTYCGGFTACRRMPLLADWDAYITARLQRYKSTGVQAGCSSSNPQCHGVIQLWELWNEPNTIYTDISVANVVILTKHEYDIIRSIDPNALIISPSGDSHYMDKYWAAGGERGVDIITFHSYNPVPEQIQTDITAMRAIMAKYGL